MDGVAIIRALLQADEQLTALVPADRIEAATLGTGTALDAIGLGTVSSVDRNRFAPSPTAKRHVTERVEVTVMAATYPRKKAILKAVKAAAADFTGDIAGATEVSVLTLGGGPDVTDEQASIHIGSHDFMVSFNEAR
jgi:hypothetical protein